MKKIVVLGSTGSIGRNTLDIIRRFPNKLQVVGLAARANQSLLERQIREFRPAVVALYDKQAAARLAKRIKTLGTEVLSGAEGVIDLARHAPADLVVSAIVGSDGLLPTFSALFANKNVALANKESIVMAGELLMREASIRKVDILPIDSEHSALFQLLEKRSRHEVKRVILTASGGPLLRYSERKKQSVSVEAALAHPTWKMGPKISIDSATLINKGFEMIEARWLFDLTEDQIDVVIHPQSIVHSLVEFTDRSIMAQMGLPDMRIPIAYSLFYPEREPLPFQSTDLTRLSALTFESPKKNAFPLLTVAREALQAGGTMPTVLNGANEVAVMAFLAKRIRFLDIHRTIQRVIDIHRPFAIKTVDDVLMADRWTRLETEKVLQKITI